MFSHRRRLAEGIENGRAFDNNRRLFMAWQMSYRGLVDAASSVDIDRIDDFVSWLCILVCLMLILILPRGREQETPVGGKRKSSKERCQSFVCI